MTRGREWGDRAAGCSDVKILLTGGTGYIGSAVLSRLVEDGHQVTAVVRSSQSARAVQDAGAVSLVGDLFDRDWLASELAQHDAAIHTAAGSDARDSELNDAVIDAAIQAFGGTDRPFVLTGGIWTYGSNPQITETSPADAPPLTAWRVGAERRLLDSDVRAIVVQPGIVHGHGAGIPAMLVHSRVAPGTGQQHWTSVHVDDLADLYVRALESAGGQTYVGVSGHNPTVAEIATAIGDVTLEGDEATLGRLGAFGEALLLDQQAGGEKARAELGWAPSGPNLIDDLKAGYAPTA